MATNETTPGQIFTFYSYKGGTGRSMAVANFACWLVKTFPALTRRVLVMDWDLEAPGLHRYFAEIAELSENKDRPGVIDYFDGIQKRLLNEPDLYKELEGEEGWQALGKRFPLDEYLIRDVVAGVDFIKAGKYDPGYAELISTFNWVDLYQDYGAVFPAFRNFLLQTYEFCLIDSRTGFNDVSGICTMLLPEKLVTVFTPNLQNILGVLDLAGRAADYRLSSADPRTLSVFPLPSRIENAEQDLRETWQGDYQRDFEAKFKSIYKLDGCDLTQYFDAVQLPHVSFYSYGEEIALLREERSGALSLSGAYERFFEKLVGLKFAWDEKEAATVLAPVDVERWDTTKVSPIVRGDSNIATSSSRRSYDSDIYISYAHIDNLPLLGEDGWVDRFESVLQTRLQQLLGERVNIWRDSKLRGDDAFNDMIAHRLSNTNVFVAVISPRYLKSEWCVRELTEFYRQAERLGGVAVSGTPRIFKVVKTPVSDDDFGLSESEALLAGTMGYRFYDMEHGRPREFSPDRSGDLRGFLERLEDLAHDIADLLKKQHRVAEGLPAAHDASTSSAVYLAETTLDLEPQRDSIRRELQQRGYEVLPDVRLPSEAEALIKVVRDCLDRCRLSIHMIGDMYGQIPHGGDLSAVEIQNELAAQRSDDTNFSRVIWMPIGVQPREPRQEYFVRRLQVDASAQRGADLVETSLEGLKALVQRKLMSAPADSQPSDLIRIYLICDRQDLASMRPLENYLFDRGYEVILSALEGDEAEILQYHKENLLLCDAVLIYYGVGSPLWLQSKLTDLRKALGWGRAEPFRATAILLGEPMTEEKQRFKTREAVVIRVFGAFNPESLDPFVQRIQQQTGNGKGLRGL